MNKRGGIMPEKRTLKRAKEDKRKGKSASTQAGEFVREEIHHVREGKHGARNTKQAIAIGLSKARRSGVKLAPPKKGKASAATRKKAQNDEAAGRKKRTTGGTHAKTSSKRSAATKKALQREPHSAASHAALSKHAKRAARSR
jgi:hypothetical protein